MGTAWLCQAVVSAVFRCFACVVSCSRKEGLACKQPLPVAPESVCSAPGTMNCNSAGRAVGLLFGAARLFGMDFLSPGRVCLVQRAALATMAHLAQSRAVASAERIAGHRAGCHMRG